MKHYIFIEKVPLEELFFLLEKICASHDSYYIIDNNTYRLMIYHNYHIDFLTKILPYYHKSKRYFVERECTYNSFVNILRQICNSHEHGIVASKKYNHSQYTIRYIIDK